MLFIKMKIPSKLYVALTCLTLTIESTTAAQIYFDNFDGGTGGLNGTTPDTTTGGEVWLASTDWNANGVVAAGGNSTNDDGAYLAFTPTAGNVYTLSATLDTPSSIWAGIGFVGASNTETSIYANTSASWMLYRSNINVDSFFGNGTGDSADGGNHTGPVTLSIELDTTTALWSTEWFVNGSSVRAAKSFTINPTITHVGFAREDGAGANFSSFELSVVPEPSVALLSGIGVLTLLRRRR
jgi:hypothetical protein